MIVIVTFFTVFLLIMNTVKFCSVHNQKENRHCNHIPFNMKGIRNIYTYIYICECRVDLCKTKLFFYLFFFILFLFLCHSNNLFLTYEIFMLPDLYVCQSIYIYMKANQHICLNLCVWYIIYLCIHNTSMYIDIWLYIYTFVCIMYVFIYMYIYAKEYMINNSKNSRNYFHIFFSRNIYVHIYIYISGEIYV